MSQRCPEWIIFTVAFSWCPNHVNMTVMVKAVNWFICYFTMGTIFSECGLTTAEVWYMYQKNPQDPIQIFTSLFSLPPALTGWSLFAVFLGVTGLWGIKMLVSSFWSMSLHVTRSQSASLLICERDPLRAKVAKFIEAYKIIASTVCVLCG